MHKYIVVFFFLFFSFSNSFSQDVLIKSNGDSLSITVVEINGKYLIYKKYGQGDRVYTTAKNKLDKIIYANGEVLAMEEYEETEDSKLLVIKRGYFAPNIFSKERKFTSKELINLFEESGNKNAMKLFKLGRARNIAGNILGVPAGFFLGYELSNIFINNNGFNSTVFWASSFASVVSITLNIVGRKNIRNSVKAFNDDLLIQLGSTNNGIGMQMSF